MEGRDEEAAVSAGRRGSVFVPEGPALAQPTDPAEDRFLALPARS